MKKFLITMMMSLLTVVCVNAQTITNDEFKYYVGLSTGFDLLFGDDLDDILEDSKGVAYVGEVGYNITKKISTSFHAGYMSDFGNTNNFMAGIGIDGHLNLNKPRPQNHVDFELNGGLKLVYIYSSASDENSHWVSNYWYVTPYIGFTSKFNLDKNKKKQIILKSNVGYMQCLYSNDDSPSGLDIACSLGFRYNF